MWFDTHAHLYSLDESDDLDPFIERARARGVGRILCVGTDVATSRVAVELASRFPEVVAGAAFHPSEAKGWRDEWAEEIDALLQDDRVVAVGETGLDFYWDTSFVDDQIAMFTRHIDLAKKHDKALVIHTRESVERALEELERAGPPDRIVFHCWSGAAREAERALALGAYISFAGNVSFKKSEALREVASLVPADRLLVETDSPYLAPEPLRGKRNEPSFVVHVGEAVAAARGIEVDRAAELTTANAERVFGLA